MISLREHCPVKSDRARKMPDDRGLCTIVMNHILTALAAVFPTDNFRFEPYALYTISLMEHPEYQCEALIAGDCPVLDFAIAICPFPEQGRPGLYRFLRERYPVWQEFYMTTPYLTFADAGSIGDEVRRYLEGPGKDES